MIEQEIQKEKMLYNQLKAAVDYKIPVNIYFGKRKYTLEFVEQKDNVTMINVFVSETKDNRDIIFVIYYNYERNWWQIAQRGFNLNREDFVLFKASVIKIEMII